jgi:hypothetical protein
MYKFMGILTLVMLSLYILVLIGATLFTVSRILSQWESQQIVQSGRERITIRAPHELVLIADDAS